MVNDIKKFDFTESINRLEEINSWFQSEEIDLDEGLRKLKEGKDLIKKCRERLAEVENEFVKIKGEFTEEDPEVHALKEEFSQAQTPDYNATSNAVDSNDVPF